MSILLRGRAARRLRLLQPLAHFSLERELSEPSSFPMLPPRYKGDSAMPGEALAVTTNLGFTLRLVLTEAPVHLATRKCQGVQLDYNLCLESLSAPSEPQGLVEAKEGKSGLAFYRSYFFDFPTDSLAVLAQEGAGGLDPLTAQLAVGELAGRYSEAFSACEQLFALSTIKPRRAKLQAAEAKTKELLTSLSGSLFS